MSPKPLFTLITTDYPPNKGGVARYLSSLVAAAEGKIKVITPTETSDVGRSEVGHRIPNSEFRVRSSEFCVRGARFEWPLWPHWLPIIRLCLNVPEEETVLVSHVFPIGTAAWIANMLGGPEYAVIFHGTDLKRVTTRWKRWLLQRICANAQSLIVNSEVTKTILTRLVPDAKPIKLTPGLKPFDLPDRSSSREQFDIPSDTKVILAVSRLVERKGIDTLIQSVAELSAKYEWRNTKYELVVIGNGPYAEPLHNLAKISGVNVRWVEDANDQTLYSWYAAADIFCLPGRETADDVEGFGIVFLEAAYAGLPVIAGDSGGASEAIINNQTGLLIPPTVDACTEALTKLINNQDLAKRLGQTGRERVLKDFNWQERWNMLCSRKVGKSESQKSEGFCSSRHPTSEVPTSDVSIVIPCYNHAKELTETLESLTAQSIKAKEVIVVDDGSDDNPEQVIDQYNERLPLSFIRLESNSGAPKARNIGAHQATGEFIIFLDADAKLAPQALEKLRTALLNNPQASFAYSDFIWGKRLFKGMEFNAELLKQRNYIHTSALIRRNAAPKFDENLKKLQDWDLWLTMLKSGKIGIWVPEVLFTVTERKTGISQWLPSFMYKIPWPILGYTPKLITKYREAERIIKNKHSL